MIRIGIICPSEIAFRRFMPALMKSTDFQYVGVAVASEEEWEGKDTSGRKNDFSKAENFKQSYGGKIFDGYENMIYSDEIDAVYLPLPPALHYKWAKRVLENGKHAFVEKPFSIIGQNTEELIALAREKKLALHENYMFVFHNQIMKVNEIVQSDEIGDVRLYRISFGFPRRAANDFRYNKDLGGGALFDCGGYTLKYATLLLGESTYVTTAQSNYMDEFKVDMYGSATLINDKGTTAQVAFGMDSAYKCELEVWGSKGVLRTGRILTAPEGFTPNYTITINNEETEYPLPADDAFYKSIQYFKESVENENHRELSYGEITKQKDMIEQFVHLVNRKEG